MNLTIRDQPIREDESEAQQAINEMANTLRLVCLTTDTNFLYSANILCSKLNSQGSDAMLARSEAGETSEILSSYLIHPRQDRKSPVSVLVLNLRFQCLPCPQADMVYDQVVPQKNGHYQTLPRFGPAIRCTVLLEQSPTLTCTNPV